MLLHLILKRDFFVQILRGEKTIEYRDNNDFWSKKLENKSFDTVHFRNGYNQEAPEMRVEIKKINKTKSYYEIHLGEILDINELSYNLI